MQTPDDPVRPGTEDLVPLVYDELRNVAQHYFRQQAPGFTLRPTELVNEACLHLIQHSKIDWQSSDHFRAIATRKIWQVIVDHLKKRNAAKRGGQKQRPPQPLDPDLAPADAQPSAAWQRVPLESIAIEWQDQTVDLLDLAEALESLASESRRLSDVVMLHWFGGLKYADVAGLLGVSSSTVEKDFRYALAWLNRKLSSNQSDGD